MEVNITRIAGDLDEPVSRLVLGVVGSAGRGGEDEGGEGRGEPIGGDVGRGTA